MYLVLWQSILFLGDRPTSKPNEDWKNGLYVQFKTYGSCYNKSRHPESSQFAQVKT